MEKLEAASHEISHAAANWACGVRTRCAWIYRDNSTSDLWGGFCLAESYPSLLASAFSDFAGKFGSQLVARSKGGELEITYDSFKNDEDFLNATYSCERHAKIDLPCPIGLRHPQNTKEIMDLDLERRKRVNEWMPQIFLNAQQFVLTNGEGILHTAELLADVTEVFAGNLCNTNAQNLVCKLEGRTIEEELKTFLNFRSLCIRNEKNQIIIDCI